jgi:hypothetical protein
MDKNNACNFVWTKNYDQKMRKKKKKLRDFTKNYDQKNAGKKNEETFQEDDDTLLQFFLLKKMTNLFRQWVNCEKKKGACTWTVTFSAIFHTRTYVQHITSPKTCPKTSPWISRSSKPNYTKLNHYTKLNLNPKLLHGFPGLPNLNSRL